MEITGDGNKRSVVYVAEKIAEYARNNSSLSHIIDAQYLKCGLDSSETFDLKGNQYLVAIRVGKGQGEGKNTQMKFQEMKMKVIVIIVKLRILL